MTVAALATSPAVTASFHPVGEPIGQGWQQIYLLAAALLFSSLIGLERELQQKSAGLRTHTLVGLGAALFMLVSKYGFTDVLGNDVVLDPSRVAAQIVTGIGFIGGGLIFVRRDAVRGLTTAAVVWVTAAIGAACGAGLPVLAAFVTGAHFLVIYGYRALLQRLPRTATVHEPLQIRYLDGRGVLRSILSTATHRGFAVSEVATNRSEQDSDTVELILGIQGRGDVNALAIALTDLEGIVAVRAGDVEGDL
ncbi:MAG TPA: MgtC/SapB family protein [Mycobacteriales bacterium]|nr:MgtC/SapB family protein [Mycobacteriales bacterium]